MEDRESGNLSRKPAIDLILELHRGSVTGSLKLERAPLQKAVYFRDGQILFAASNDPKDQLASILVEEGKLGPDQMQVAQARVSPGNPLAKVLTELGYISQRELAEAARIKVEKILTDLYTWKEGTYQFATKSLPKGAIDLELSTARLLSASIRRVQDRDWVLRQLGSLETVLSPTASLPKFLADTEPEPLAADVLKLADGVKSVKQIGALSSLGEFEVCKVLAAGLVAGALGRSGAGASIPAAEDAFSFPSEQESFSFPPPRRPSFGDETVGIPEAASSPDSMSYDTIFQAAVVKSAPPAGDSERTVFDASPARKTGPGRAAPPAPTRASTSASELLIDEPEPASNSRGRSAPRPKHRRAAASGRRVSSMLKWLAVAALAGGAGFSIYYFVWPLLGGAGPSGESVRPQASVTTTPLATTSAPAIAPPATTAPPTPAPSAATTPSTTSAPADPRARGSSAGTPAATSSVAPLAGAASPPRATSTSKPPDAVPTPSTTVPSGAPKPPPPSTAARTAGSGDGRSLLRSGDLAAAARAFQGEISTNASDKFTLALGIYCNQENAGRVVAAASGASDIYVLPTSVEGRSCYRVIWGLYDSRDDAERAVSSLPNGVRAGDVAPVAVSRFLR
jgi:septal ring-binding cell division protein DamX